MIDSDKLRLHVVSIIEEKGITGLSIARKIGMSSPYLSKMLAGKSGNIWTNLSKICDAIGVKTWEVLKQVEDE